MAVKQHQILLFGGSGSGKTTLLSSLWEVSNRLFLDGTEHLKVSPDDDSAVYLTRAARALKEAFMGAEVEGRFVAIERTATKSSYDLTISRTGSNVPLMTFSFTDTPGGWSTDKTPELTSLFRTSRAAIMTIDCVELLEGRASVPIEQRRNTPELSQLLVRRWLTENPSGKLLLCVVPMKTETWLRERDDVDVGEGGALIHSRILDEYADMFTELKEQADRVAVVLCPVQTVGNLTFVGYEQGEPRSYPGERWRRIIGAHLPRQGATGYAPVDSDQPLRHILNWAIIAEIQLSREKRKTGLTKFIESVLNNEDRASFDWLRTQVLDLVGSDRDLVRAVSSFIRGTKTAPPFGIVQGEHLVRRVSHLWDKLGR